MKNILQISSNDLNVNNGGSIGTQKFIKAFEYKIFKTYTKNMW